MSDQSAISKIVVPAIESFRPDVIAVSAGFDAHYADPLGDMAIDSTTYWFIANAIDDLVRSLGLKGSFWVLEGGYNPLFLGPCVRATIEGLLGNPLPILEDQEEREVDEELVKKNKRILNKILKEISPFL